jgi:tetratricopeptide (TPR) repeat protein
MMTWYMDGDRRYEEFSAQALRLLPDDEPCAELVLVLETCAAVHARHFDSPAVLALADRAIDLAAALGLDPPVRAMHYRAVALCDLGDATGLSDIRRTLEIAKRLSTSDVGVISFNLVQDVLVYEGPPAAIKAVEEWRDFAEQRGDAYSTLTHSHRLAWCLFRAGEWQAADALASELDGELERRGMWLDLEELRSLWSQILDLKGQTERAAPLAEWAERRGREGSGNRIDCLVALAGVRLSQGDVAAALELVEELATTTPRPMPVPFALVTPAAVRIAASCGDVTLVEALLDGLVPERAFDSCAIAAGKGLLHELAVDPAPAKREYAAASKAWEHLGEPYESAHCLLGQGRCLLQLGRRNEAQAVMGRAAAVFARLGASPALELVTALAETR